MTKTTAETNPSPADLSARDIAAIIANPTDAGMDELYRWMDAYQADLGHEDSRVAQHEELFDVAIDGLANLVRMSPRDEIERMLAAQLVAAHMATMDCYRRARTANLEHRSENLAHANKLTRAFVMLLGALQRQRDKADKSGGTRPPSGAEALPRERGPLGRHGARQAAGMARRIFAEQPHAKGAARHPAPAKAAKPAPAQPPAEPPRAAQAASEGPPPRVERTPVAEQPHAKAAAAPSAVQTPPEAAAVPDRPWADPVRWGKDPRAGRNPRNNPMQRGPGAKGEK